MRIKMLVVAAMVIGCAHDSTPPIENHARVADPLVGTAWTFCDGDESLITFQEGGRVGWDSWCTDHACDCGDARWTRDGGTIRFDCNNYTEYDVTFDRDRMRGEWHRVDDASERAPTCMLRVGAARVPATAKRPPRFRLINGTWLSSDGALWSR